MSSEAILRNIYSYLEVLETARTEKVSQWTPQSLENATKWGTYCEQIFHQSRGKPYLQDLDKHIRRFNLRPWNLGETQITLGLLEKATQHVLDALLQNTHLSSVLYARVMKHYVDSIGEDNFIQTCCEFSQAKASLQIVQAIEASLRSPSSPSEAQSSLYGSERTEAEAFLLFRYLQKTSRSAVKDHRTLKIIDEKLGMIASTPNGIDVLLPCLRLVSEVEDTKYPEVVPLLVRHIVSAIDADAENKIVFTLPPGLLTWGAAADSTICSSIIRRLVVETGNFSPEFDPFALKLMWQRKHRERPGLSYEALVKQFDDLRSVSEEIASSVDGTLLDLAETDDNEIWSALIKDMKS